MFEHAENEGGTFTFTHDVDEVGSTRIPEAMGVSRIGGVDIGRDVVAPITDIYNDPLRVH